MTMQLERRNGYGRMGRPVDVVVNCFEVTSMPNMLIQQYDVAFSDTKVKEKRRVIEHILETQGVFGRPRHEVIYDGNAILYIPGSVQPGVTIRTSESAAKGRPTRPDQPGPVLEVTLTHASTIDMSELAKLVLEEVGHPSANLLQAVTALNVAIRWDPSGRYPARKNNFFVPLSGPPRLIGAGLEVWAGYFTSIRPGIGKMILNLDRAAGAFVSAGKAVEIALRHLDLRDPARLEIARLEPRLRVKFKRFLKGLKVKLPGIIRDPNNQRPIKAISNEGAASYFFEMDGQATTVQKHIEKKYNIRLRYPHLPCVQLSKIAWFPLECCEIIGGTQFLHKLRF